MTARTCKARDGSDEDRSGQVREVSEGRRGAAVANAQRLEQLVPTMHVSRWDRQLAALERGAGNDIQWTWGVRTLKLPPPPGKVAGGAAVYP